MTRTFGRGPCGSLKSRVDHEIRQHVHDNQVLRRARYSLSRRILRRTVVERTVGHYIGLYLIILLVAVASEWAAARYAPAFLPGYYGETPRGFLKDLGSYLLAAQIGILAIVSVAVGVVTLLSERNDGASVNTDIRLYYVESHSYELTVSGVALLLIISVQLFWPLQHILHSLGLGGRDYAFKLSLAGLHTAWFCLNLLLFLQFITTTLRFVEPNTREALRERYSANEIIPRDARERLLRAYYAHAPEQLFGKTELEKGPTIYFGYPASLDDAVKPEITRFFSTPATLVDVRLRPLQWILNRWRKRVKTAHPQREARFGRSLWDDYLAVVPSFDGTLEGPCDLIRLRGDVRLTAFEKWVARHSFRFAPVNRRAEDLPTPENFLEQLVDKLVRQAEESSTTGFRAALNEVTQFHVFILGAQDTTDDAGNPLNLAEIGGYFSRPDADLVRQYRRAFAAAADKIGSDTFFIDRLSNLATRLIPKDGLKVSPRVIQNLLDLGVHQVIALEDWLTKRAVIGSADPEPGSSAALTGADARAYETTLIEFVGGWETLEQTLISSFGIERRPSREDPAAQWTTFAKSLPVLRTHLQHAAYFLVAGVWNDDAQGAEWFRDLLLRWPQPFYGNLQNAYLYSLPLVFLPDLTDRPWPVVQSEALARTLYPQPDLQPGPVTGHIVWEMHCDVVCVAGLVPLYWYASGQLPSQTAARAALLTLRRERRETGGSDLIQMPRKSEFRLLLDFAIRYALNPRFADSSYSGKIDGLVQSLTRLASPRMVSGRIYGGFGMGGFESLRVVFLAAMAANFFERPDDGLGNLTETLQADPVFESDKTVRNFIWSMREMVQTLDTAEQDETYVKAIQLFNNELDIASATARLNALFSGIVTAFEALRIERLRTAPLDEARISLVRRTMTEAVLANGPAVTCFGGFSTRRDVSGSIPVEEAEAREFDRGSFVDPEMSEMRFDELPGIFVEIVRSRLANQVWQELYHRPKRVLAADIGVSTDGFWRDVVRESATVGPDPIVLVPYQAIGDQVSMATMRQESLGGFVVSHLNHMPSGHGTSYLGTIEGVHIYSTSGLRTQALLCSGRLLREIDYGVVHEPDGLVDFSFVEGDDPRKSRIRLKFAQRLTWNDDVFVEFAIAGVDGPSMG